VMVTV
jgi:hypothetical protein